MGRSNGLEMLANCQAADPLSPCQSSGRATRPLKTPTCCVQTAPSTCCPQSISHLIWPKPSSVSLPQTCCPSAFPVLAGVPLPSPYAVALGQDS